MRIPKAQAEQLDDLPAGVVRTPVLYHIAGATDDGWIVIALFDSEESWERFRDQTLMPGLQRLGDAGFAGPPEQTAFKVHRAQQG